MNNETIKNPFESRSPFEAVERSRRERLLFTFSMATIPSFVVVGAIYGLMWISKPVWQMGLVFAMTTSLIAVCLLTAQLAKRQKATLGSYLFLSIIMLVLGANTVLIAGLISVLALAYATAIVAAGDGVAGGPP